MRLKGLLEPLEESSEFKNLEDSIKGKKYPIGIYGISESGRGYIIDLSLIHI